MIRASQLEATWAGNHAQAARKNGKFLVLREMIRKEFFAKLQQAKVELRKRMHSAAGGDWEMVKECGTGLLS